MDAGPWPSNNTFALVHDHLDRRVGWRPGPRPAAARSSGVFWMLDKRRQIEGPAARVRRQHRRPALVLELGP